MQTCPGRHKQTPEEELKFYREQYYFIIKENERLQNDNRILMEVIEKKEKRIRELEEKGKDLEKLLNIIKFKDAQIAELNKTVERLKMTVRSLQESILDKEVYKIPQYQKTITFLRSSLEKLQEENERLKKELGKLRKPVSVNSSTA